MYKSPKSISIIDLSLGIGIVNGIEKFYILGDISLAVIVKLP